MCAYVSVCTSMCQNFLCRCEICEKEAKICMCANSQRKKGNGSLNLQTSSSACPCHELACPQQQSLSCSPSPCPGGHLPKHSCAGRPLVPGSGKRATGSEGVLQCIHSAQAHLLPPCHLPNATTLLEEGNKDKWIHFKKRLLIKGGRKTKM